MFLLLKDNMGHLFKIVQLTECGLCKFHGTLTLYLGELSKIKIPGADPGKNMTVLLDSKR